MKSRIITAVTRASYAAIGAAIGAAVGGLFSRNAASTGGALGALAGATVGEIQSNPGSFYNRAKTAIRGKSEETQVEKTAE